MAQSKVKQAIVTGSTVLGLLILVIIGVVVVQSMFSSGDDRRYEQPNIENTPAEESPKQEEQKPAPEKEKPAEEEAKLDPATVSSISIAQMGIEVSYIKGIGSFEYAIKRTPGGSQYVEFKNETLRGTKCTDDQGVFASIIEKPTTAEASTLTKKKTVDGIEYGLSLAATNCTSDEALLKKYQDSFSKAFGLLKTSSATQE